MIGFYRKLRWVLGLLMWGLPGCSESPAQTPTCYRSLQPESATNQEPPSWRTVAEPMLDGEGISDEVAITGINQGPLTLRISVPADPTSCVQLHSVIDASNNNWVTPPSLIADYGSFCVSCPQRTSVGVGGGVYVLPSIDPAPAVTGTMRVRAALRDCTTFLPYRSAPSRPDRLRIEALTNHPTPTSGRGELLIELVVTPGSFLYADEAALPTPLADAIAQVNDVLQPGELSITALRVRRSTISDPLTLAPGAHTALGTFVNSLQSCQMAGEVSRSSVLPVVLAGCIRISDPVLQTTSEPEGYVPHIPFGVSSNHGTYGVYLRGHSCQGDGTPFVLTSGQLAKLLAHELGHALGLYHTVEANGTTDQLADTGADNLMNYKPSVVAGLGSGFTASQLAVMRRHPLIRY